MKKEQEAVIRAAVAWWQSHRPLVWGEPEHLKHPSINTCSDPEKTLALAAAKLVRSDPFGLGRGRRRPIRKAAP